MIWRLSHVVPTCGKVIEFFPSEPQRFLITEKIGVIERGFIHELQGLRDKEHGKYNQINFPSQSLHLGWNLSRMVQHPRYEYTYFLFRTFNIRCLQIFSVPNSILQLSGRGRPRLLGAAAVIHKLNFSLDSFGIHSEIMVVELRNTIVVEPSAMLYTSSW